LPLYFLFGWPRGHSLLRAFFPRLLTHGYRFLVRTPRTALLPLRSCTPADRVTTQVRASSLRSRCSLISKERTFFRSLCQRIGFSLPEGEKGYWVGRWGGAVGVGPALFFASLKWAYPYGFFRAVLLIEFRGFFDRILSGTIPTLLICFLATEYNTGNGPVYDPSPFFFDDPGLLGEGGNACLLMVAFSRPSASAVFTLI